MLDSRILDSNRRMQSVNSTVYSTKVIVMRRVDKAPSDPYGGIAGTPDYEYELVVRGYPAMISPVHNDLQAMPTGQIAKGDFTLCAPYKRMADGGLLIRERDVIIDMHNPGKKKLVLYALDPGGTHVQIVAGLQDGVVEEDLDRQG
jgi:hypothetical protein